MNSCKIDAIEKETENRRFAPARYPWLISIILLVIYIGLWAKALNLDGLGYAERVKSADLRTLFVPGHVLYDPIMLVWSRLVGVFSPIGIPRAMQLASSIFGALGIGIFMQTLRRLRVGDYAVIFSGLAMAFTFTYWSHSTDLTPYAFSTFVLIVAFNLIVRRASIYAIAAAAAFAVFIHQSNVVFLPVAILGLYDRRIATIAKFSAAYFAMILIPYIIIGSIASGGGSPVEIIRWIVWSSHGYPARFELMNIIRAGYGFANAGIFLDNAGTSVKGAMSSLGGGSSALIHCAIKAGPYLALMAGMLVALRRRIKIGPNAHSGIVGICAAWIACYCAVALVYFTTDHDRWVMMLPAIFTLFALAFDYPVFGRYAVPAIAAAGLFAINLTSAIYPTHLGTNNPYYQEAKALNPYLQDSDLVLFWGHDHVGTPGYLRQMRPVDSRWIFDSMLAKGRDKGLQDFSNRVESAMSQSRRVLVIGVYGANDSASDVLDEAQQLGVRRDDIQRILSSYKARPMGRIGGSNVFLLLK